jgi:hypothetical protein
LLKLSGIMLFLDSPSIILRGQGHALDINVDICCQKMFSKLGNGFVVMVLRHPAHDEFGSGETADIDGDICSISRLL